jgi:uncharacterized repeat protein (TIGR02543 family)
MSGSSVIVADAGTLNRSGYNFGGWNTQADGKGTYYAAGNTFTMGSVDLKLYALWTTITYTVSYNGNGNSGGTVPTDSNTYVEGASVSVRLNSGNLVRTGYSFVGWNTSADGTGTDRAAGSNFSMGAANIVLYAKWSPTYTITYNGNGNSGGSVPVDSSRYLAEGKVTVKGKETLERTDHTFTGWNTKADGTGVSYASGSILTMGSANVTLYAQWSTLPTYTVSYDGNGYSGGTVPLDANHYLQGASVTVAGQGSLVRSGYNYIHWNTSADGTGISYSEKDTFIMGSRNIVLYAQWSTLQTYTVTYDGNGYTGGSIPSDSNRYLAGASVTVADAGTMVRSGYSFSGWYRTDGAGAEYSAGSSFTIGSADIILFAKWTMIQTYTVSYNGNGFTGGAVPSDASAYQPNAHVTVAEKGSMVRSGYSFTGWNTRSDGQGIAYASGSTLVMGSVSVILYAQWLFVPTYSVTYNGNGNTGGSAPVDSQKYASGETVTVLGLGNLIRSGYGFAGWNTIAGGSGSERPSGSSFAMPAANVVLYAQWSNLLVSAPTFSPIGGTYTGTQTVSMASTTPGASIRFTRDGNPPSESDGTLYTEPISVSSTQTIKAIAYKSGMTSSSISSATFVLSGNGGIVITDPWTPTITFSGQSSTITFGGSMTVTATVTPAPEKYAWYLDGIVLTGSTGKMVSLGSTAKPGAHVVTLIVTKGTIIAAARFSFTVVEAVSFAPSHLEHGCNTGFDYTGSRFTASEVSVAMKTTGADPEERS